MALTRPKASQIITNTIDFSDSIIRINSDETGANTNDIGIIFERGTHTNAGLIWDESIDAFRFISTTNAGNNTSDINISAHHDLHIGGLISSGLTYPTVDGTEGQVIATDGNGALAFVDQTGSGNQASFSTYRFTATDGQTTFSGADDTSTLLSYTAQNLIVTLNGSVLEDGTDYTATDGTSIVLATGAALNDELNVMAFTSFTVADTVSAANGGTFTGSVTLDGDLVIADKITHADDTNTAIRFPANDTVTIETAGSERMRIDSSGNITVSGTVDGRDIAADGSKLDGVENNADVTDAANVQAAGALMDSELADISAVKALDQGVATTDSPSFVTATLTGTGAIQIPTGTEAERPTPATGQLRFNTDEGTFEGYDGAEWGAIAGSGNQTSFATYRFTATQGQTTFSGADDTSALLSYTPQNLIVTLNGIVLEDGAEYTASNGTSIVLATGAALNDELNVMAFTSFTVAEFTQFPFTLFDGTSDPIALNSYNKLPFTLFDGTPDNITLTV